jgi:hypothetical protein
MSASIYGTEPAGVPVPSLHVKQGASLQLLIAVTNDDGTVFSFTGVTVTAQVKDRLTLTLIATLTVVVTGIAGQLSVLQATDTWEPGTYVCDFKFVQGAVVLKSQSFGIIVDPAVTV